MRKSKADLVRGWLEKARRDFNTAVNQLNVVEPFADIVCFHAQQAAEKYLKAYLVWQEVEFPRTHALEDLVLLAAQKDPEFLVLKDEAASLTPYAVETRYPEFEEPVLEDANESVEIAKQVANFVLQRLSEEVRGGSGADSIRIL
jgi:HEPN domain-containing protein